MSWATGPVSWKMTSTSPFLRAAARVVSSGHDFEDDSLDARRLTPVPIEGHQLDARRERDKAIRAGADRRLLERFFADMLDVFLGDDPPGGRGRRAIERHEVRPGLLHMEAHSRRIDNLHLSNPLFQQLSGTAS